MIKIVLGLYHLGQKLGLCGFAGAVRMLFSIHEGGTAWDAGKRELQVRSSFAKAAAHQERSTEKSKRGCSKRPPEY